MVLQLIRERKVDLRERLSEIEALEERVLIALQHRGIDELLDVFSGNLDEALEDGLNETERRAAVVRIHPNPHDTGQRHVRNKLVSGLPEGALVIRGNEYALPAAGGHDIAVLLLKILVETPGHPDSPQKTPGRNNPGLLIYMTVIIKQNQGQKTMGIPSFWKNKTRETPAVPAFPHDIGDKRHVF